MATEGCTGPTTPLSMKGWRENHYHGHGKSYHRDGTTIEYEGAFVDGMRHGHGRSYGPDGTLEYEGGWQLDEPEP